MMTIRFSIKSVLAISFVLSCIILCVQSFLAPTGAPLTDWQMSRVSVGMNREWVIKIIGKPHFILEHPEGAWVYDVLESQSADKGNLFSIEFDESGRVRKKSRWFMRHGFPP